MARRRPVRGPGDAGRTPGARNERGAARSTARPEPRRRTATSGRRTVGDEPPQEPPARAPLDAAVRRRFTSRAAVLLAVFCLLVLGLAYPLREYVAQHRQIEQLQQQERRQRASIAEMQRQQQRWQDPAYVEQQARKRLHYAKPGEVTYVVVDGGEETGDEAGSAGRPAGPSWADRLWTSVRVADRP